MKWVSWAVFFVLLAMTLSQLQRGGPQLDQPAPEIQAPLLTGGQFVLDQHKGKIIVMDFWATWCPPCRATLPALNQIYQEYKDDSQVEILTVNSERMRTKRLKKFLKEQGWTFPVIRDRTQNIKFMYNIQALPTLVIIDQKGKVVHSKVGASSSHVPTLVAQLKQLIESLR